MYEAALLWLVALQPLLAAPPADVQYVSSAWLQERACRGSDCDARGWYADTGVIYLDERYKGVDSIEHVALLLHEACHHAQHVLGSRLTPCERERECYAVQQDYWLEQGQRWDPSLRSRSCH